MFYFVNGRWVKDQVIRYGILRGYHSHLQKNNYPSIISHIRIDPSLVDVNVHPSKTEVRFQYQNEIQALISTAIRKRLRKADWASPANNETMYSSPENKNEIFDLNESYQKTDENLSLINKTPQTNANYKNTFKASDENFYKKYDIHVHVPAGAISKDGPSAGVAMTIAIISLLTNIPVKSGLGMTGETSLRGNVLPIGGLREKATAAHRAGLNHIIAPYENKKDLEEIPAKVRSELKITFVKVVDEAIKLSLNLDIN